MRHPLVLALALGLCVACSSDEPPPVVPEVPPAGEAPPVEPVEPTPPPPPPPAPPAGEDAAEEIPEEEAGSEDDAVAEVDEVRIEVAPSEDAAPSDASPGPEEEGEAAASEDPAAEDPAAEEPAAEEPAAEEEPAAATEEEPAPVEVSAQTWSLSSDKSQLYVQVFKDPDTAAAGMSHDHVILAKGWSGSVTWHPTDPSQCQIDISLPVAKLVADPAWLRAAVGYEGELSEGDRKTIKKNLLAKSQLNVDAHPKISFSSTSCSASSGSVKVSGTLKVRGKSKTVSTTMEVDLSDGFTARGTFKAKHTDFGFEPYSALLGALKNRNQMTFTVKLVGT